MFIITKHPRFFSFTLKFCRFCSVFISSFLTNNWLIFYERRNIFSNICAASTNVIETNIIVVNRITFSMELLIFISKSFDVNSLFEVKKKKKMFFAFQSKNEHDFKKKSHFSLTSNEFSTK